MVRQTISKIGSEKSTSCARKHRHKVLIVPLPVKITVVPIKNIYLSVEFIGENHDELCVMYNGTKKTVNSKVDTFACVLKNHAYKPIGKYESNKKKLKITSV